MAEYIDREAVFHAMKMDVRPPFAVVRDFPAADVQPVVRCKDCKWHESAHGVCDLTSNESIKNFVHENDFCSYGERKEHANEHQNPPGH